MGRRYLWLRAARPETLPIKRQHIPLQTRISHGDVRLEKVYHSSFIRRQGRRLRGIKVAFEWRRRARSRVRGNFGELSGNLGQGGAGPTPPTVPDCVLQCSGRKAGITECTNAVGTIPTCI